MSATDEETKMEFAASIARSIGGLALDALGEDLGVVLMLFSESGCTIAGNVTVEDAASTLEEYAARLRAEAARPQRLDS